MDKEQFDHIETFFRQAAMNISPSANEEGWKRMEVLLNREFHKKRRRAIFWWWPMILFFLFLGGVGVYVFYKQLISARVTAANQSVLENKDIYGNRNASLQNKTQKKLISKNDSLIINHKELPKYRFDKINQSISVMPVKVNIKKDVFKKTGHAKEFIDNYLSEKNIDHRIIIHDDKRKNPSSIIKYNKEDTKSGIYIRRQLLKKPPLTDVVNDLSITGVPVIVPTPGMNAIFFDSLMIAKVNELHSIPVIIKRFKRLYLITSLSPEASGVKKIAYNNLNIRYGIGIGYHLNKNLSLQAGVYTGKKTYTAGDGDYTIKPGSYISKIININADCYFYTIPISVRYDVFQKKKYHIYAVAGLSSLFSKRETYDYHFYNRNGMYRNMISTYKNNTDLFSVANLSLGFEQMLTHGIYLQAEPYIDVPVSGVGEGKVRLYSTGFHAGIKYQPLKKKNKK